MVSLRAVLQLLLTADDPPLNANLSATVTLLRVKE